MATTLNEVRNALQIITTVTSVVAGSGLNMIVTFSDSATAQDVTDAKNICLAHGFTANRIRTYSAILTDVTALTAGQLTTLQTAAIALVTNDPFKRLIIAMIQLGSFSASDKATLRNHALTGIILQNPSFATNLGVNVSGISVL